MVMTVNLRGVDDQNRDEVRNISEEYRVLRKQIWGSES